MRLLPITLLLCACAPNLALAVPLQLAHQGRLLDAAEVPLESDHDLHFGLYDAPTDGTLLWDETVTQSFTGGFYSTVLGADDGNPLDDGIFATSPVYLELAVDGGDPLLPRQEINSVPFALRAATAENVEGGFVDATDISIDGDLVVDADGNWVGRTPPVDWADLSGVPGGLVDGEDADVLGGLSCSDGFVAKFDMGSGLWACGADDVLNAAGVLAFVDGAVVNLGAGSGMAGSTLATLDDLAADTLAGLSCSDGGVAKFDFAASLWTCGTDLVLDSGDVLGMVDGAAVDLGAGSAVAGVDIATLDDLTWSALTGLPPGFADEADNDLMADLGPLCADGDRAAWDVGLGDWTCESEAVALDRLETIGAAEGDILTYEGGVVTWSAPASSGSPCVLQADDPIASVAVVLCGSTEVPLRRWEAFQQLSAGNDFTCGVTMAGAVRCWGDLEAEVAATPAGTFSTLAAGENHACGINQSNGIECWGNDQSDQASPPTGSFSDVCAGNYLSCGMRTVGTVECWGSTSYGQTNPPSGIFTDLACGGNVGCVIDGAGAIECWGSTANNVTSPPAGVFSSIAVAWDHACAITATGSVECWGYNHLGQASPPAGSDFIELAVGGYYSCGLRSGGAVECWGANTVGQSSPPGTTFTTVTAGTGHACGVASTGSRALCWGSNGAGQLQSP